MRVSDGCMSLCNKRKKRKLHCRSSAVANDSSASSYLAKGMEASPCTLVGCFGKPNGDSSHVNSKQKILAAVVRGIDGTRWPMQIRIPTTLCLKLKLKNHGHMHRNCDCSMADSESEPEKRKSTMSKGIPEKSATKARKEEEDGSVLNKYLIKEHW